MTHVCKHFLLLSCMFFSSLVKIRSMDEDLDYYHTENYRKFRIFSEAEKASAPPPNYETNENRNVSDLLNKIKNSEKVEIDFIDVWGEGFLASSGMITGFKNSYNMNKFDQLVSNPPDMGRQIPNLIPLTDYNNFIISYQGEQMHIPQGSVKIITLMGAPLISKASDEICNMIAPDGNIIIYGFKNTDQSMVYLRNKLQTINFTETETYTLSDEFNQITIEPLIVYTNKKDPDPYVHDEL